jgi:hypothetical protein
MHYTKDCPLLVARRMLIAAHAAPQQLRGESTRLAKMPSFFLMSPLKKRWQSTISNTFCSMV